MPLYEYKCKCGFDRDVLFTKSKHWIKCPRCGGHMKRQFPKRVGLRFVGSGFYKTDYK